MRSVATDTEGRAIKTSHLFITGGTGFVGRHVVAGAVSRGWNVTLLGRRISGLPRVAFVSWDLSKAPSKEALAAATCLIHLAVDTRPESEAMPEDAEVDAAVALIAALPSDARVVFISSQSSNPSAPTRYGRTKARVEAAALKRNGIIIRPGMVYAGDQNAGLHSRLCSLVRGLPVIPDLRPPAVVQPIHVEDLAEAILRATAPDVPSGIYALGHPTGVTMTEYLRAIARIRLGLWRPRFVAPAIVLCLAARFAAPFLRIFNIDPQNLIGLTALRLMDARPSLQALEVKLRPFCDGLRPNGRSARRELLMEGHVLFRYLSGALPSVGLLKRYALAVEVVDGGQPIMLAMKFAAWPGLLRLVEDRGLLRRHAYPALERRLDIATRVVEASTLGAGLFMKSRATSALAAGIVIAYQTGIDLIWQGLRIVYRPSLRDDG